MATRFWITYTTDDLAAFHALAERVARLKTHGPVQVCISSLKEKSWHDTPAGRSPWHAYGNYDATLARFFPHPAIAAHLPADWVANNRRLLLDKAAIAAEYGLEAEFFATEPFYLPESFYREHPQLRGPRCEHPRRTWQPAFAPCTDQPEVLEMYRWMMAELKRQVPGLAAFDFKFNDSGSGFCWSPQLYPGANGPTACRRTGVTTRMAAFVQALCEGAREGGGEVDICLWGSYGADEAAVTELLPDNAFFRGQRVRTPFSNYGIYPLLGFVNPLGVIRAMDACLPPNTPIIELSFIGGYRRGQELPETIERVVEIVDACLQAPAPGFFGNLETLRALCAHWAGDDRRDDLCAALVKLDEALRVKSLVAPQYDFTNCALPMRFITRPLLLKPEMLTPEEERYFLPYIFNPSEQEARLDYTDYHGYRLDGVSPVTLKSPALDACLADVRQVATMLESLAGGDCGEWLAGLAASLRIWCSFVRSCRNFTAAQLLRERVKEQIAGDCPVFDKTGPDFGPGRDVSYGTYFGNRERTVWNYYVRDELDNANELIALLTAGHAHRVWTAPDDRHQDEFLLGPSFIDDLHAKVRIMHEHWYDMDRCLPML